MLLNVFFGECSPANQELGVLSERGGLLLNGLVHPGLSKARLVGFIVSIAAVADDVDYNVLLVLGAVVRSKLADEVDSLDVVAVYVEDGSVDGYFSKDSDQMRRSRIISFSSTV